MRAEISLLLALTSLAAFVYGQDNCTGVNWSYNNQNKNGPSSWSSLCSGFSACQSTSTSTQSPIDISPSNVQTYQRSRALDFFYGTMENAFFFNNGHAIQVTNNITNTTTPVNNTQAADNLSNQNINRNNFIRFTLSNGNTIDSSDFYLVDIIFHTPSEHTFYGRTYPLEMQLVHQNSSGNIAILAYIYSAGGSTNSFLGQMEQKLNQISQGQNTTETITLGSLIQHMAYPYLHYSGSLTYPPCTENVDWFVHRNPLVASSAQISQISNIMGSNNRPTQALNGRSLQPFLLNSPQTGFTASASKASLASVLIFGGVLAFVLGM